MLAFNVLAAVFAAYMLAKHGRRALLFALPGLVRVTGDPQGEPITPMQIRAGEELEGLGFRRLGVKHERSPGGGLDLWSDVWAQETEGAYADVFSAEPRSGRREAYVAFVSDFDDGAMVLTANHPRLAIATDTAQTGGLADAGLAATWAAHRRAIERFAARHGRPAVRGELAARLEAARRWYRGLGRRELRRLFMMNFVNALVALALLVGSVNLLLRALK